MVGFSMLLSLLLCCFLSNIILISNCLSSPNENPLCHPNESSALLSFKNSFTSVTDNSYFVYCPYEFGNVEKPNSTVSWETGSDCCGWSGVTCDEVTGFVIGLHLMCGGLRGTIDSNSSLFSLTHIQILDLSGNRISGPISPNFGRFAGMVELDLSFCKFTDQVPFELGYLSNLKTLDLHWNLNGLWLETHNVKRIVANLTNLLVLSLGGIDMCRVFPSSFKNLSTSLTSLNLHYTCLKGEFPEYVFRLPNLDELDLCDNSGLTGLLPKYNWTSSLSSLDLSWNSGLIIDLHALLRNATQITSLGMSSYNFGGQIPWEILNLENLTYLDLSENYYDGALPEICKNNSKSLYLCDPLKNQILGPLPLKLKSLTLSQNFLNGTIPSWLYSLPSLQELYLAHNYFSGQICEFQFNSLKILDLSLNELHGLIPRSIFHQVNLYWLELSSNNLNGVVKIEKFSKLKSLKVLRLSYNSLSVVSTGQTNYTLPDLRYLDLASCNMSEFPYSLRSLKNLETLDLSNNRIGGSVPEWFVNVGNYSLYELDLSFNFLTHMCQILWENLHSIDLQFNHLQGHLSIPQFSIVYFVASNNQFSGEISSLICNISYIELLDLANNSLSGNIPPCIGNLSDLAFLNLRMNKLNGTLPYFAKESSVKILSVNENQLEGSLPESLANCKNLEVLDVGNNKLSGPFPQWLESLENLKVLVLRSNIFHGQILWENPFSIDVQFNQLQGHLPIPQFSTSEILASKNQFNKISSLICNIGGIEVLDLANNSLSGNIPPCIGNLRNLTVLDLRMNKFEGTLPYFSQKNSLTTLNVNGNRLEGLLSESLVNCKNLKVLDVGNNKLNSSFPQFLESFPNLQVLILRSNRFTGVITESKIRFPFQKMRVMDLSNNEFTGPLPTKYFENLAAMMDAQTNVLEYMEYKVDWQDYYSDSMNFMIKGHIIYMEKILKMFIAIDLSANNFTGEIPDVIGKLKSLKGLNLSHNSLTGVIPVGLGNLSNLECLDLSSNELVGTIPWQLASYLKQLQILNLSSNSLEGPIPHGSQFDTFNDESYAGNSGLCGFPLSQSCSKDSVPKEESDDDEEEPVDDDDDEMIFNRKALMMGCASGVVMGISLGYIVFFSPRFDCWLMERFGERLLKRKAHVRLLRKRRSSN